MNQKIEDILEFHKIRHAVREFANTQKAKTMILQLPIETCLLYTSPSPRD